MRSNLTVSSKMALISISSVSMISGFRTETPAWHMSAHGDPGDGPVPAFLLLSPNIFAEPIVVVFHHRALLFGLVDGVAETFVEDQLHRNLAVPQRLV